MNVINSTIMLVSISLAALLPGVCQAFVNMPEGVSRRLIYPELTNRVDQSSIWTNGLPKREFEIYGYRLAPVENVPVKVKDGANFKITWRPYNVGGTNGCFALVNGFMVNTYYNIGGRTYSAGTGKTLSPGCITALKIGASGSPSSTYETYSDLSALQRAQNDPAYYIIPLYTTDSSGNVTCDWRTAPSASMGENL